MFIKRQMIATASSCALSGPRQSSVKSPQYPVVSDLDNCLPPDTRGRVHADPQDLRDTDF